MTSGAADEASRLPASAEDVFAADVEVGRDLAAVDWSATPIGPPGGWSQSLRTAVSILLSSRFPMWMAWGPRLTFFCNGAYRRDTLGQKYPWALGRPADQVWDEIWDDIGPRIDRVLSTGEATWDQALRLFLERSGYSEETYHTFSYSPLRDDHGAVVGMLCVVSEDTERVLAERRMATLLDLGADSSVLRTEQEMLEVTASQLDRNQWDLPFTLTYLFDGAAAARLVASTGITPGHPAAPQHVLVGDETAVWPAGAAARGEAVLVDLGELAPGELPTGAWPRPPTRALVVPLPQQGGAPVGFLVAALNRYRPLDEGYRGFVDLVAGHVATRVSSARGYRTQQRRAEELAELDRAKTIFFSNISHEFRTPLTLIAGPVQELRSRLAGADPTVREEVEVIHRNGLRLGKLVNALLDFSRIEAGRMHARYEPVDLAVLTRELASVFRSAIEKAGLRFDVDCAPLPFPVYVDRDMWEKVVLNLLSNAVKFTFDGSIGVRVRALDDHVVVTVADTGVGIAEDEMPRLFERFHRVENVRARSSEGSGIGLALVKELVSLHGGEITALSAVNQGTTFTIRLPTGRAHLPADAVADEPPAGDQLPVRTSASAEPFMQETLRWLPAGPGGDGADPLDAAAAVRADPVIPTDAAGGRPVRVLVADDNADMREYLVRLLRGAGHTVEAVGDGQAALDAMRAELPDLVVSDVMMPGVDGLELVAALRADRRTASVPVLLLSARAGEEASVQGLEAGADDYLVKPFAAAELLARVRANVELARLRGQHARWRNALVDSLQEGFFVSDADGTVIETNSTFTEILGYGPDGLPYRPPLPWWPDAETDPHAYARVTRESARLIEGAIGQADLPLVHRDGHPVWLRVTYNRVEEPGSNRHVAVGTVRDITAEHYSVQRDTALAALAEQLGQANTVPEALAAAVTQLQRTWSARRVVVAAFATTPSGHRPEPELFYTSDRSRWAELAIDLRELLTRLREAPLLAPQLYQPGRAGITVAYPGGVLVVWVDVGERRPVGTEDRALLSVLAGRLGQGVHRVHEIDQQREAAVALQHAILGPASLPAGFAVRYQPAMSPLQVGGDWYDTVPMSEGRIGIVVGDCVGHGLDAAAVMGQLRSACRALLLEHSSPARALTGLDRFAALLPAAECTTVFCATLDPATGELVYSSAGHPPPILVRADGTTTTLEGGRGIPLGLRTDRHRDEGRHLIAARSTLLLYTDGLVERRRASLDDGIARAAAAVHDGRAMPVEDLASQLMTALSPVGGYEDDVALLLYRPPGPFEVDFVAVASELAPVRHAMRAWLARCDLGAQQINDVLVAVGEACNNAVEHGHREHPAGLIRLRAAALADRLWVSVIDSGRWKPRDLEATARGNRGRGISLMRGLMHHVTIDPTETGTTVEMYTRIAT